MFRTAASRIVRLRATGRTVCNKINPLFSKEKEAVAKSLGRSLSMSADDDTTTRPPGDIVSTWVQLYCGDEAMGQATQIFAATRNVGHLADLVRAKVPLALRHCHAKDLVIYRAGTLLDALNADEALNSWDAVPDYTTGEQPLVVIAPAQAPQPESDDRWDFTKDIAKAYPRMYHTLPEPRLLIGRQLAEEMVRDIALVNFHGRKTMDRAGFTFLVASGHISIGKTRIGKETPRLVSEACSQVNGVDFAEPVYLQINFRQGAGFDPYRFDQPELSPSEALGARLMGAFYGNDMKLKKTRHDDALAHIVKHVRTDSSRPDAVVPIVIHFEGHAGFITDRNNAFGNDKGKDFFLSMLQEIGSAGTAIESDLRDLHLAGNYFIVPIATGATFSSADFDQFPSCYCVGQVPLPVLDMQQTFQLASLYLHLAEKLSSDRLADMENPLFQIALGDTGGLPGFIRFACEMYGPEHVCTLHTKVFCSVDASHLRHWHTTVVSVFLARPVVSMGDILEADYTVRDAIYSGTVFLRNPGELGLAPALLSKFNKDYIHQLFDPLLVKTLTTADQWTWQDFEKAHVLFLSATMAAIIKEQKRFSQITLGTFLRNVQPEASRFLSYRLCLPKTFNAVGFKKQTRQCIPRSNAKPGSKHDVCTEGLSEIFVVAEGTPIIDSFLNIDLQTTGTNQQRTTLFIQYKHSGLESETSVSTMNYHVNMLANRLAKCGWSEHQEWIFLWVTNRKVVEDALPHDKLLWVSRAELMDHAPVLGSRGLVPIEVPRGDE